MHAIDVGGVSCVSIEWEKHEKKLPQSGLFGRVKTNVVYTLQTVVRVS
eukprot:COSAG01_NODE_2344_length_7864_cov_3.341790_7_plen_48_part_00